MNPNTGAIYHGTPEVIDHKGKQLGVALVPIGEEERPAVEAMNTSQRKAWAKRKRKGLARLKAFGYAQRAAQCALELSREKDA